MLTARGKFTARFTAAFAMLSKHGGKKVAITAVTGKLLSCRGNPSVHSSFNDVKYSFCR